MGDGMNTARKDIHNSNIPVLCRACEARHRGICGALTPVQLVELNRHTKQHEYESGKELQAAGEDVQRYSNILRGVVKLTKLLADGRQQIVGLQFAPDFTGRPFRKQSDVIADAATSVQVCSFPRTVLEDIIKDSPELGHRLHEQALDELDEAREWMLTLGRKNASEKVASFLFLIASHADPEVDAHKGPIEFELPLKRSDIADFLGLTIETVSRQITKLRKTGVIEVENNRTVSVPSLERLRAMCEQET
jgi:CRP/FNR family transcriptional regulator, anaerobic regulatory protein